MMFCRPNIYLRIMICFALALFVPTLAWAENSPIPGTDLTSFEAALAKDRLMIKPIDHLGFDAAVMKPLSISPDGTMLLVRSEDGLWLYMLSDGKTQALVPQAGDSNLSRERIAQQFAEVEAGCISWSPDGSGLAISFPGWVYRYMRFNANIWAADFQSGSIVPLFALPTDLFKDFELHGSSVPVRSAFSLDGLALYYECFADDPADLEVPRKNYYYRYDMSTKTSEELGYTPYDMASGDEKLWVTDGRLVTTVASNKGPSDGGGIAVLMPGRAAEMTLERQGILAEYLHGTRLITGHGDAGILLCLSSLRDASLLPRLLEFQLTPEGKAVWNRFLLLLPDLSAGERLMSVDVNALNAAEDRKAYARRMAQGEVLAPYNAAYSPDGGYLLLGAGDASRGEAALYVLNVATGVCGRIALPEGMPVATFAYGFGPNRLPGMVWAEGNRLLLRDGDRYRLFELAIQE